jgi:hypothetical protein
MKTTIHTPATTNVRPVTYGRNPQLRTPDARRTRFLHFNLIGPPALHSFSVTGDQLIAVIADAIATSGKPVAEYWLSFAELRALVDAAITSTGGWASPYIAGPSPAIADDVRDRARAILLAHVPLLLESDVPTAPESVAADVATIGDTGAADLDTGAVDPVTDELTDTADAGAFPHDVAAGAGLDTLLDDVRTKQQLADALRAVPGRDELPELSDRSLKRANRVQLAALAELFDV